MKYFEHFDKFKVKGKFQGQIIIRIFQQMQVETNLMYEFDWAISETSLIIQGHFQGQRSISWSSKRKYHF